VTSLEQSRAGGISNFMNSLPFLNEQAKWGRTQDLLGMATNFLGRSPVGQTSTGQTSQTSTGSGTQQGTDTRSGTTVGTTNPGWGSVLGGLAGIAAPFFSGGASGLFGGSAPPAYADPMQTGGMSWDKGMAPPPNVTGGW
jgi:hypothetical protein